MARHPFATWAGPLSRWLNSSVWIFHGLFSKLLGGAPRHRLIVGRVLGGTWATPATIAIGAGEVLLGLWILRGRQRIATASLQTLLLVGMNTLELIFARDLLLAPLPMVVGNLGLIALAWMGAVLPDPFPGRT